MKNSRNSKGNIAPWLSGILKWLSCNLFRIFILFRGDEYALSDTTDIKQPRGKAGELVMPFQILYTGTLKFAKTVLRQNSARGKYIILAK